MPRYVPADGVNQAAAALAALSRVNPTKRQQAASRDNGTKGGRPKGSKDSYKRTRRPR